MYYIQRSFYLNRIESLYMRNSTDKNNSNPGIYFKKLLEGHAIRKNKIFTVRISMRYTTSGKISMHRLVTLKMIRRKLRKLEQETSID